MFIQTEETGNEATLKFLPNREVLADGMLEYTSRAEAAASPLAERIFSVPGVTRVVLGTHYLLVTQEGQHWQHLKPEVLGAIMDHFTSGAPVVRAGAGGEAPEGDTIDQIREAIREVIDPELGFNIVDLGLIYDIALTPEGAATVTMTTTTPGCPATNYLKSGTDNATRSISGVTSVDVQLTYDPRWGPDMMSPAAKAHFGMED